MYAKPTFSILLIIFLLSFSSILSCKPGEGSSQNVVLADSTKIEAFTTKDITPGAHNLNAYVPLLRSKKVGLVVNHTSLVGKTHLIDTLLSLEINVEKIFSPEHGFTGKADAGEKVGDTKLDEIPIISLYGSNRIPDDKDLEGLDILLFDMQDVGVRFYTYISTLHYVMETAAENNIPLIILDRPNPNGHYVDGPVLEADYKSFVGMHPIPVVYGMTIGELAQMINGEAWLKNGIECDLTIIKNVNYSHLMHYQVPVPPSPNLPDQLAITLYPSLCFFEGTPISVGRGTERPFTIFGHPIFTDMPDRFVPAPNEGAKKPKLMGEECFGHDLSYLSLEDFRGKGKIEMKWLRLCFDLWPHDQLSFFNENGWFDNLAGTNSLRKMIEQGKSTSEIRASWQADIQAFKEARKEYLLYEDFE